MSSLGIVTIGRNEGERLERCLRSVVGRADLVVYVDSGSNDGSVAFAKSLGVDVVELDMTVPFTMARGRNAGYRHLFQCDPELELVQFIDGDCEVVDGWLEDAADALRAREDVGVVSGRRRERHREATIYNRMIDMEWDTPVGETRAVLGDMMVKAAALRKVDGFNPTIIAAEDDEMCIRIRQAGWRVWRLDADMTIHDANLTRFGQWWKRMVRAGHGFAEGRAMHGGPPERHFVAECRRTWFWTLGVPALTVVAIFFMWWWSLPWWVGFAVLLLYPVSAVRSYQHRRPRGDRKADAAWYGLFSMISKFPTLLGMLTYYRNRLRSKPSELIEYK